jgi:hypothetical protein
MDLSPPEEQLRGFSRAELEAGPSDIQMHAAILNDIRRWRQLDRHLDEGVATCSAHKFVEGKLRCADDQAEIASFDIKIDPQDLPNRIEETALYCPKESVYYYHYVGGPRKYDVWLGPYKIDRPAKKLDDYK